MSARYSARPAGDDWLEAEVNPVVGGQHTVIESDYTNNTSRVAIKL